MKRTPDKLEFLLTRLNHEHSGVRSCAATALGVLRDTRAVEPLLEHLRSDPSRRTREAAAVALGNIGDKRAVKPLLACLKQEHDPEVCECIIETLGWMGGQPWSPLSSIA
jgi:HEAT repeat protein